MCASEGEERGRCRLTHTLTRPLDHSLSLSLPCPSHPPRLHSQSWTRQCAPSAPAHPPRPPAHQSSSRSPPSEWYRTLYPTHLDIIAYASQELFVIDGPSRSAAALPPALTALSRLSSPGPSDGSARARGPSSSQAML